MYNQVFSIAAYVLYAKAVSPGLGTHQAGHSSQSVTQTFQVSHFSARITIGKN